MKLDHLKERECPLPGPIQHSSMIPPYNLVVLNKVNTHVCEACSQFVNKQRYTQQDALLCKHILELSISVFHALHPTIRLQKNIWDTQCTKVGSTFSTFPLLSVSREHHMHPQSPYFFSFLSSTCTTVGREIFVVNKFSRLWANREIKTREI